MRNAILTCTALALLLSACAAQAQEVAPFRLTDFWAYLELTYRLDQINNKSTGVETDIDDDRRQIELGMSSTSYVYHPKLLQMRIAGSLLSDRQTIVRELTALPSGSVDPTLSKRKDLLVNLDATLRFLKDKPYPATITYIRDNPIVSTGVEGSFTQENERVGFDFQLRDVLPFNLALNASQHWSFGESLDRVIDNSTERLTVKAKKTFSEGNRLALDYETSVQESRNGDPRRPIQETIRETERLWLTTSSRHGGEDQVRIDQTLRFNRRDEPDVTDIMFSPIVRWTHNPKWESIYRYDFSQAERPESDFENRTEALSASVRYSPSLKFNGQIRTEFDRSNDVDRLSQNARGLSGHANIKHDTSVGQLSMSMGLGYRLDDRVSESPLVIIEEEPVTFVGTAPVPLSRDFVVAATVIVRNDTLTQTYIEGVDYLLSEIGSTTRIERIISGSILDGEMVLVDYEAETGGTFAYSQVNQDLSADFRFARFHSIFFRYHSSRQNLQSGSPTLPFNSVEAFEVGLREQIPLRSSGVQISGEARYRRQDEDINPFDQASILLSIQAPLSSKMGMTASVSRHLVDNFSSDEDSDLTTFNASLTWQAWRNLTIRADGTYDKDTGGTVLRSNTQWKVTAQWRYRKISLNLDSRYRRQQQGDLDNDHYEFWLRIRRDMF
jgi:hypothetical protein